MNSIEDQVQRIEQNIRESKKTVELGEALARLKSNRDFKKVVMEGFFEQEAIRLVHLKADFNMQSPDSQKSILTQMDAIGAFAQFLDMVARKADLAKKSIAFDEEVREELTAGELA